jgi:hypothetical protein
MRRGIQMAASANEYRRVTIMSGVSRLALAKYFCDIQNLPAYSSHDIRQNVHVSF